MIPLPSRFLEESGLLRRLFGDRDAAGNPSCATATILQLARHAPPSAFLLAKLSELYTRLDGGQISETEFTAREIELRDQLDQLQAQVAGPRQRAEEKARRIGSANVPFRSRMYARK
jgi:hypothetical protein